MKIRIQSAIADAIVKQAVDREAVHRIPRLLALFDPLLDLICPGGEFNPAGDFDEVNYGSALATVLGTDRSSVTLCLHGLIDASELPEQKSDYASLSTSLLIAEDARGEAEIGISPLWPARRKLRAPCSGHSKPSREATDCRSAGSIGACAVTSSPCRSG